MAFLEQARIDSLPDADSAIATWVLDYTLSLYPLVLLLAFLVCGIAHSVLTARIEEAVADPSVHGPDGNPLPVTKKERKHRLNSNGENESWGPQVSQSSRKIFRWISLAIFCTFFAQGLVHFSHAIEALPALRKGENVWQETEPMSVYLIGGTNLYLYFLVTLFEWRASPTVVHFVVWALACLGELVICLCLVVLAGDHSIGNTSTYRPLDLADSPDPKWQTADLTLAFIRLVLVLFLTGTYIVLWIGQAWLKNDKLDDQVNSLRSVEEATPLLHGPRPCYRTQGGRESRRRLTNGRAPQDSGSGNTAGFAKDTGGEGSCLYQDEQAAFYRPEKIPRKTWWEYVRGYGLFFQYVYPKKSWRLQLLCLSCMLITLAQRVVNILVPLQIGALTDALMKGQSPWGPLSMLLALKLLQGPSMLLGALRALAWLPVSQYSYRALTTSAFEHVHSLSLDFHLGKRTGEVLSALNKGASINQFLEQITFQVFPMTLDLIAAIVVFYKFYDGTFSTIVSSLSFWYLYLTIRMAQTRADQRRAMTNADREEEAVKNDSITSYETVKYFNAERWEFGRYRRAIQTFQAAESKVTHGMNKMSAIQACVFMSGMTVVLVLGAYQVANGHRTVGNFVTLLTYLAQLQEPLNYFSQFYKTIQQAMISGERLLELFKIRPTVVDAPGAKPLASCDGHIRWNNVTFAYQAGSPALTGLDFECKPGTTTAFVGESGGGKSTIFRLMFRYYNTTEGSIEMDGQDVKNLTIDSVRGFIGVVPQDTTLFNETLMYNLKYAKPHVSDEQVFDACRAAAIHDRIMSFPEGYNTKVGDRGLRLSGGERQRVAIARTILKDPKVIMLDEATSALDAHTEQEIQDKLGNLGEGRTLLIIAHRLSTITHADQIVVLNNGAIVEKGNHEELVAAQGRYASMWEKQVQAERAAEKARVAHRRAHKLMRKANIVSNSNIGGQSGGYDSLASSAILPGGNASEGSKVITHGDDTSSSSTSSDADSTHSVQGDCEHP